MTREIKRAIKALEAAAKALRRLEGKPIKSKANGDEAPEGEARPVVLALFDYTALGLEPWRQRGYECHAYDIKHPAGDTVTANGLHLHGVDLHSDDVLASIVKAHEGREVAFAMGYPPCTDLSRAGARYWKAKAEINPKFQEEAADWVMRVAHTFEQLKCPYYLENPATGQLRNLWRPPDHTFEPHWYGGYLEPDDAHPKYPKHIPNQDAYTKRTGLWCGGGFTQLPPQKRVDPTWAYWDCPSTGKRRRVSPPMFSGSAEGKEARHATPRGFSAALCAMYAKRSLK